MKILIYGAGVIGSLYAVYFSKGGSDVSIYARGNRLQELKEKGLSYFEKNKIETANVEVLEKVFDDDIYDFIFLTVREDNLKEALTELKENKSKTIVTMVNTISPYAELEKLCGKGKILPAFPGAGGSIDCGILDAALTPRLIQPTTFGEKDGKKTERSKLLASLFKKSKIPYQIVPDMHNWQLSHLAMVVPLADAYYKSDEPKTVYLNKKIMHEAGKTMRDNFRLLAKRKMLSPNKFYLVTICPLYLIAFILKLTYKSEFGNKFMYRHSMKAPKEMQKLKENLNLVLKNL